MILNEFEIRNIRDNLRDHLDQLVDPVEHRCVSAQIDILAVVLNE
jgi:hypothetical protein